MMVFSALFTLLLAAVFAVTAFGGGARLIVAAVFLLLIPLIVPLFWRPKP